MIRNYITIAWRHFIRQKEYSLLNILGLTTGLTCFIVTYLFVQYESTFDGHQRQGDDIYRVVQHLRSSDSELHWNTTAYPLAEAIRNDFSEPGFVTQVSGPTNRILSADSPGREPVRFDQDNVLYADPDYFNVFDVAFINGSAASALKDPYSIVLTESVVPRYFPETRPEDVIGKFILLNNKDRLTVTAVVKDSPCNTNYLFRVIIPYSFFKMHNPYPTGNWSGNYQGTTFVLLSPDVDKKAFEEKVAGWKKKYLKPEDDQRIDYYLQPLAEIHTETFYGSPPGGYAMPAKIISAVRWTGIFILIIACVNFVNLATAQATSRSKEVGVRKVIGGTRWQLFKQFSGEQAWLLLITLGMSLALAQSLLAEVNSLLSVIHLNISLQWDAVIVISLVGIAVVFLAGLYPSLVLSAFRPVEVLKNKLSVQVSGGLSLRRILIVLQFGIVQIFVIGTIVIAVQMHYIRNKELGFNREAIVTTHIPVDSLRTGLHHRLSTHAGIEKVSFSSGPPTVTERRLGTSYWLPSQSVAESSEAELKSMDEHYIGLYGLSLVSGKNFTDTRWPFDEFIVNETLIRSLGWTADEAIGQRLFINEGEGTIVGVVKDFHNNSMQEPISPCVIVNWSAFLDYASIQLSSASIPPGETLQFVEETWKEFFPGHIYQYLFIEDFLEQNYVLENLIFRGFTIFALLAALIGCLGLYGMIRFMTIKRTREVGVRKVLGASVASIFLLFSKEFVLLVLVALILAAPLAWYGLEQWLSGFVYSIEMQWWMFAGGGLLAIVMALVTISYQSMKTAVMNPVRWLRSE